MKKSIIILLLFCSYLSFAQGEEGRAITGRIQIDVGKIDTLYFTNDTLYLTEDGRLFKTEILVSATPQTLSWNGGTGVISISDGNSIDIDGRYGQLGAANTWSSSNNFGSSSTNRTAINNASLDMYGTNPAIRIKPSLAGATYFSLVGYSTFAELYTENYLKLMTDGGRYMEIKDDGIYGNLDAATTSNVIYYNTTTDEWTYGAASGGSSFLGVKAYATTTQNITANTPATITFPSEDYDTGNDFSSNTFIAPETGYYRITVNVRVTTGGTNPTFVIIELAGVTERSAFSWSNQDVLQQNYIATETFYITASTNVSAQIEIDESCTISSRSICIEKL